MVQVRLIVSMAVLACLGACKEDTTRVRDIHGMLELHRATKSGDITAIEKLFEEGANANVPDRDGVTALHRAARNGDVEVAQVLLEHFADPKMITQDGWDALHLAAWNGHAGMVKLLLQYGAVAKHKTPQGWTLLHMAAIKDNEEIIETALLDWPAYGDKGKPSLNDGDSKGETPLLLAIRHKHYALAKELVMKGADVTAVDGDGNTTLHLLAGSGERDLALLMISHGADVNRSSTKAMTPYTLAVEKKDFVLTRLFLERGGH
jgi:ankyrin